MNYFFQCGNTTIPISLITFQTIRKGVETMFVFVIKWQPRYMFKSIVQNKDHCYMVERASYQTLSLSKLTSDAFGKLNPQ